MKTSELTGADLAYWVAKDEGLESPEIVVIGTISSVDHQKYYRLPCEVIGASEAWRHFTVHPVSFPGPYWGFFPEIGNDDDGYGCVEIVYCDSNGGAKCKWVDRFGKELLPQPLMWAPINEPLAPISSNNQQNSRADAISKITIQK